MRFYVVSALLLLLLIPQHRGTKASWLYNTCVDDDEFEPNDLAGGSSQNITGFAFPLQAELCPGDNDTYLVDLCSGCGVAVNVAFKHTWSNIHVHIFSLADLQTPLASADSQTDNVLASFTEADYPRGPVVIAVSSPASSPWRVKYALAVQVDVVSNLVVPQEPSDLGFALPDRRSSCGDMYGVESPAPSAITIGTVTKSQLACPGDESWFAIPVLKGQVIQFALELPGNGKADLDLDLINSTSGNIIATSRAMKGNETIVYGPSAHNISALYIRVLHYAGLPSQAFLSVTETSHPIPNRPAPDASPPIPTGMPTGAPGPAGVPSSLKENITRTPTRVNQPRTRDETDRSCQCRPETVEGVTWPAVVGCGSLSSVQCPRASRDLRATRVCQPDNSLGRIDSSACENDALRSLAETRVDARNAEGIARSLREQTRSVLYIGTRDVESTAKVMDALGQAVNASLTREEVTNITRQLTNIMDSLLTIDDKTLAQAEASITKTNSSATLPAVFGRALSGLSRSLPDNTSYTVQGDNVLTAAFNLGRNQSSLSFSHLASSCAATATSEGRESECSVGVPFPLANLTLEPTYPRRYFSFAVYTSARLFRTQSTAQEVDAQEMPNTTTGVAIVSTPVVLAQAEGHDGTAFQGSVVFQLNKTHDVAGDDSCAFWDYADNSTAGEWSGMGCVRTNNKLLPSSIVECRCTHLTNFAVLTTPSARVSSAQNAVSLAVITYVGVAVSVPAMLLTVAVFASYRKLRTLGRVVTMHLCVNLSIALLLLVFGIDQTKDQELCIGVAASLHFFLLTSFAWMLVEGVRLYKAFVTVFECEKQKQTHYAAFAYACPGVIVGVTAAVLGRNAYDTETVCWLRWENGAIWSFIGPLAVVVALNIAAFVRIFRSVIGIGLEHSDSKRRAMLVRGAKVSASFFCIMGVTWVFGIFAVTGSVALQYLFAISNVFQGLFIFVFHCLRDRAVRNVVRGRKAQLPPSATASSNRRGTTRTTNVQHLNPKGSVSFTPQNSMAQGSESQLPATTFAVNEASLMEAK